MPRGDAGRWLAPVLLAQREVSRRAAVLPARLVVRGSVRLPKGD
jgi:hypothetical protein